MVVYVEMERQRVYFSNEKNVKGFKWKIKKLQGNEKKTVLKLI